MSFVARPPDRTSDPAPQPEATVVNDGFFPDIEPAFVREVARIPTSITPARLRAAILGAILSVETDLRAFAAEARAAGHARLADVAAPRLDDESVHLIRYRRAVALFAKAELIERHRDFDTTAAGDARGDDLGASVDDLRRDAIHAIRDMLGKSRTGIWLI